MEMNLGGPVWHVSISARPDSHPIVADLKREAYRQLNGVGDPDLGQWEEWTGRAYHLRRRLSAKEQGRVGPVVDIRRTPEAWTRAERLGDRLLFAPAEVLAAELGGVTP